MGLINKKQYNQFLEQLAKELDISPSKYKQAVERYRAVGKWLDEGDYPACFGEVSIYTQGSFRLGTVVRPLKDGEDAEYDIDLVCDLPCDKEDSEPQGIKHKVGNRLKENANYDRMLKSEGKRCWTLEYADEDDIGFHLDILPSVLENDSFYDTSIAITHKEKEDEYRWSASNPRGYAQWFEEKNKIAFKLTESNQKAIILSSNRAVFDSIDDVPDQLIRTPLQRAIQIMKRHRDIRFNDTDICMMKPISMIITTLAGYLYQNETDILSALSNIVERLHAHSNLLRGQIVFDNALRERKLIERRPDGTWYIGNPVNPEENFADRWHEDDNARAKAFFKWVEWVKMDLVSIMESRHMASIKESLSAGIGKTFVDKHFALLGLQQSQQIVTPRRVHITEPAQPWRK